MLLIEQCVEHALALLVYANPPSCRSHWMYNNCIRSLGTFSTAFQQREYDSAILAPESGKSFIKATHPHKSPTPAQAARTPNLAPAKIQCFVFVLSPHTA